MLRKAAGLVLPLCLFFFSSEATSQPLQGTIHGHFEQMVYLWQYNTARYEYRKSDSLRTDAAGSFTMNQPVHAGLYGLSFSHDATAPAMYIWMGEGFPIRFYTTKAHPQQAARWEDKTNNSAFTVGEEAGTLLTKFSICSQLLDVYPDSSGRFYKQIQDEYLAIQKEMEGYRQTTARTYKGTATEHIVRQYYFALPGKQYREPARTAWLKVHFLDSVNFADPLLQRSHLLRDKINQYFGLYGFPERFDNAVAAAAAIRPAVEILMKHCLNSAFTRHDPALQLNAVTYVSGYLFQRFNYMGMDDMVDEVTAQVPDELLQQNTCTDEGRGGDEGISRIITYKKLAPGKQAPSFRFDAGDGSRSLQDIQAKNLLIVFWASWCAHCQETLPQLSALYNNTSRDELEILTVSVDTDTAAWKDAVTAARFPWLNHCSGQGWNDPVAKDYGVMGTPVFFLLDKEKKIIGKPQGAAEVQRMME